MRPRRRRAEKDVLAQRLALAIGTLFDLPPGRLIRLDGSTVTPMMLRTCSPRCSNDVEGRTDRTPRGKGRARGKRPAPARLASVFSCDGAVGRLASLAVEAVPAQGLTRSRVSSGGGGAPGGAAPLCCGSRQQGHHDNAMTDAYRMGRLSQILALHGNTPSLQGWGYLSGRWSAAQGRAAD